MILLDIISDYPRRIPHRIPDTVRQVKKVILDTIQSGGKGETPDTIDSVVPAKQTVNTLTDGGSAMTQQLRDIAPWPPKTSGLDDGSLLWTVLVVLVSLSLCFYFVQRYRRSLKQ